MFRVVETTLGIIIGLHWFFWKVSAVFVFLVF